MDQLVALTKAVKNLNTAIQQMQSYRNVVRVHFAGVASAVSSLTGIFIASLGGACAASSGTVGALTVS